MVRILTFRAGGNQPSRDRSAVGWATHLGLEKLALSNHRVCDPMILQNLEG